MINPTNEKKEEEMDRYSLNGSTNDPELGETDTRAEEGWLVIQRGEPGCGTMTGT